MKFLGATSKVDSIKIFKMKTKNSNGKIWNLIRMIVAFYNLLKIASDLWRIR